MAQKYGRGKFKAHENYIDYMEMIVQHENFQDMPNAVSSDGRINWQVSSGKTTSFYEYYKERYKWWIKKADSIGMEGTGNSNERFSKTARIINPTGYRPCRLCGNLLNVGYFYLNYFLVKKWSKYLKQNELLIHTKHTRHYNRA